MDFRINKGRKKEENPEKAAAIGRIADDLRASANGVVEECSDVTSPNRLL